MVLIYSEDIGQINFELTKFLQNKKYLKYIYDENWKDIIQQIDQISFFESDFESIVVIKSVDFLADSKINNDQKLFLESLYNSSKKIIITSNISKLGNEQKKYFEKIIELKKLNKFSMKDYLLKVFNQNNLKIKKDIFNYLCEKLPPNGSIINSEINKIISFPNEEITIELLNKIIDEDINENIFKLIDNFLLNNYEEMAFQLNHFIKLKIDFYEIFNILVSQLYNLKLYLNHFKEFSSFDQICKDFGIMKFQIEKWEKLFYKIDTKYIEILLKNLLELEKEILLGKKDFIVSIKSFLLKGINYEN